MYDCCGKGYLYLDPSKQNEAIIYDSQIAGGGGGFPLHWWKRLSGQTGRHLCDLDVSGAHPQNPNSRRYMSMDPYLCCTYIQRCKGGSCGVSSDCSAPSPIGRMAGPLPFDFPGIMGSGIIGIIAGLLAFG